MLPDDSTLYQEPLPFPPFPKQRYAVVNCLTYMYIKFTCVNRWFMSVYLKDVWTRLPELMAQITSTFGSILKIDSTKKVVRKLQGKAAGSASWATNIGNEKGEIVMSVLTDAESFSALRRMAEGLMCRYKTAGQPAPKILYTDRDCCSLIHGVSKYKV